MKKIGKNIIAASVTGTLALMGAPPDHAKSGANVEVTAFQPAEVRLIGSVTAKGNSYFLVDPKTGAETELRGAGIKRFVGMSVTIEGKISGRAKSDAKTSPLAVQILKISSNANSALQTSFAMGPAKLTALITSTAIAGTIGGLYGSGVLGEDQPASRQ